MDDELEIKIARSLDSVGPFSKVNAVVIGSVEDPENARVRLDFDTAGEKAVVYLTLEEAAKFRDALGEYVNEH